MWCWCFEISIITLLNLKYQHHYIVEFEISTLLSYWSWKIDPMRLFNIGVVLIFKINTTLYWFNFFYTIIILIFQDQHHSIIEYKILTSLYCWILNFIITVVLGFKNQNYLVGFWKSKLWWLIIYLNSTK